MNKKPQKSMMSRVFSSSFCKWIVASVIVTFVLTLVCRFAISSDCEYPYTSTIYLYSSRLFLISLLLISVYILCYYVRELVIGIKKRTNNKVK
ncbi:MAG: hypothetical protein SNJ29_14425 [Rikenellaceae bacterium]